MGVGMDRDRILLKFIFSLFTVICFKDIHQSDLERDYCKIKIQFEIN